MPSSSSVPRTTGSSISVVRRSAGVRGLLVRTACSFCRVRSAALAVGYAAARSQRRRMRVRLASARRWTSTSPTTSSRCATAPASCSTASPPPTRVRAVVEAGGGVDADLWAAMVEQGWLGVARRRGRRRARARAGRGRGAARGDRAPRRAGARSRRPCSRSTRSRRRRRPTRVERLLGGERDRLRRVEPPRRRGAGRAGRRRLACSPGVPTRRRTRRRRRSRVVVARRRRRPGAVRGRPRRPRAARAPSRRWTSPARSAGSRFDAHAGARASAAPTPVDALVDRGATFAARRDARRRVARARPGGRVRQGPGAVRPADRQLPGGEAPVRRHARRRRGHALDRRTGPRGASAPTIPTRRSPRRPRRSWCCRRVEAGHGVGAPGARRHRLHVGARPAPLPEARAARPARRSATRRSTASASPRCSARGSKPGESVI